MGWAKLIDINFSSLKGSDWFEILITFIAIVSYVHALKNTRSFDKKVSNATARYLRRQIVGGKLEFNQDDFRNIGWAGDQCAMCSQSF